MVLRGGCGRAVHPPPGRRLAYGIRANAVAPGLVGHPRMKDFLSADAGRSMAARTPCGSVVVPSEVAAPCSSCWYVVGGTVAPGESCV